MTTEEKENLKKYWCNYRGYHHQGGGGAFLLIIIGILLLLTNFGFLSTNIWHVLVRFWPVLLIIMGIRIILGRNIVSRVVSLLIILLVIFYALSVTSPSFSDLLKHYLPWWQAPQTFDQFGS